MMRSLECVPATDGMRGFDCNMIVSPADAHRMKAFGYAFARRYIRRDTKHAHDLHLEECLHLLEAGLMLAPVQHVERDGPPFWIPSIAKGLAQANVAVDEMQGLGFPHGTMVALDLEGVDPSVPARIVIAFANTWNHIVQSAGFVTDLYVGRDTRLTASQLYHDLSFSRYWRAGNLNDDEVPVKRGCCMRQHWRHPDHDQPPDTDLDFNVDVAQVDALGNRAILCGIVTP